jgi:hypothetical protein
MWIYEQVTGNLFDNGMELTATGYSGHNKGRNNPEMQHRSDVGPIPCGLYTIQKPVDSVRHGPFILRLRAEPANEMFGRAGFAIHGENIEHYLTALHGCIILPRGVRETIWSSQDLTLRVISGNMA